MPVRVSGSLVKRSGRTTSSTHSRAPVRAWSREQNDQPRHIRRQRRTPLAHGGSFTGTKGSKGRKKGGDENGGTLSRSLRSQCGHGPEHSEPRRRAGWIGRSGAPLLSAPPESSLLRSTPLRKCDETPLPTFF
ncbi:hypothetical protein MRX96_013147 [Rhipicephalus microplus]